LSTTSACYAQKTATFHLEFLPESIQNSLPTHHASAGVFRLDNTQLLFPEFREVGKKNEAKTIRIGQLRSLDLSFQDDQLLAQQCTLYN
jgi:hypothetical protein